MSIEKRIKSLHPYVIQMRFPNDTAVVDVVFKDGWGVPTSKIIKAIRGEDKSVNYYMFYTEDEDSGLDDVLNYIEQVININLEREKKYELLKIKTEELKELFRKNPLAKLVDMKFVLGGETLVPDIMPDDFDVQIDEVIETPETINEEKIVENVNVPSPEIKHTRAPRKNTNNTQKIELPPKGKIELEEHLEPKLVCRCSDEEICPVCAEEKY